MSKPREYTTEEIREKYLRYVWGILEHCLNNDEQMPTTQHKMEVFMHSMLVTLDGGAIELPGFIVAPMTNEEDKDYHIEHGENYYPFNNQDLVKGDIAGGLHELMYKFKPDSIPDRN